MPYSFNGTMRASDNHTYGREMETQSGHVRVSCRGLPHTGNHPTYLQCVG